LHSTIFKYIFVLSLTIKTTIMKTLDNIIDYLSTTENDQLKHKGRFIDFHTTKRTSWNRKRNYGF